MFHCFTGRSTAFYFLGIIRGNKTPTESDRFSFWFVNESFRWKIGGGGTKKIFGGDFWWVPKWKVSPACAEKLRTAPWQHCIIRNESWFDMCVTELLRNCEEFRLSERNLHLWGIGLRNREEFRTSRNRPTEFRSASRNLALACGIYEDKKWPKQNKISHLQYIFYVMANGIGNEIGIGIGNAPAEFTKKWGINSSFSVYVRNPTEFTVMVRRCEEFRMVLRNWKAFSRFFFWWIRNRNVDLYVTHGQNYSSHA